MVSKGNGNGDPKAYDEQSDHIAEVRIDFMGAAKDVPVSHVNHLVTQFVNDEFYLTLFSLTPPAIVGDIAEQREQLKGLTVIQPTCVVKAVMTERVMRQIVDVLTNNLKKYDERKADGK